MDFQIGLRKVKLTSRELDILSCLLNGRGVKKTAQLLSISPKTAEVHIRNIMLKIECNSRDYLIDYVEKSGYLDVIKRRYGKIGRNEPFEDTVEAFLAIPELPKNPVEKKDGKEDSPDSVTLDKPELSLAQQSTLFLKAWIFSRSHLILASVMGGILFCAVLYILTAKIGEENHSFKANNIDPPFAYPVRSEMILPQKAVFLDRATLIKQIHNRLHSSEGIRTVVLAGTGGVGKTTLARHYARDQNGNAPERGIVWEINAETKDQLILSFERLADALAQTEEDKRALREVMDIKESSQRQEKLLSYVKRKLYLYPGWLLIYDNVESFPDVRNVLPYDPKVWGNGKVILTTQNRMIGSHSYVDDRDIIKVGELSPEEKRKLFNNILYGDGHVSLTPIQEKETKNFLETLPPFPLDISTAAYYLKFTNISYADYVSLTSDCNDDFSGMQENILTDIAHYKKTRYGIIGLSIKQLLAEQPDCKDSLLLISLVSSQDIPRSLLDYGKDSVSADRLFYHLKKYSLVSENKSSQDSMISIHRSTQAVILSYLSKMLDLENKPQLVENVVNHLEKYVEKLDEADDLNNMKYMIPHLLSCLSKKQFSPLSKGHLGGKLGHIYWVTFLNIEKARDFLTQSLRIYEKNYQGPHLRIAWILGQLGVAYKLLGYLAHKEPQEFLEKSLETYKICYGDEMHEETGWLLVTLSGIYRQSQAYDRAQASLEKGLKIYKAHYGEDHLKTSWVYGSYGRFYRSFGNYVKAKDLLEKAILIHQKTDFQNFMDRAWPIINVGIIYKHCGDYAKAKEVIEEGLSIYEKHLDKDHTEIAWTNVHLASVYGHLGDWDKAKQIIEKSLVTFKKFYGADNVVTAWVLKELGVVLEKLKDYKASKHTLEESLSLYKKHYDDNHVQVAFVMNDLGKTYLSLEELERAELLFDKAISILRQKGHPKIYRVLENMSDLYLKKTAIEKRLGNIGQENAYKEKSLVFLREALGVITANFLADSPYLAIIKKKIEDLTQNYNVY